MKKYIYLSSIGLLLLLVIAVVYLNPYGIGQFGNLTSDKKTTATDKIEQDKKVIRFISPQVDNPVWLKAKAGFENAAKEYGFFPVWSGSDDHSDSQMMDQIFLAIDEKADAVITCPFNPTAFTPSLMKLKSAGIPVITVAVDSESKQQRYAYIGTNSNLCGKLQSESLYDKVGGKMKIGVLMSNLDAMNQVIQLNELKNYIKTIHGAEIVAVAEDRGDPIKAMEVLSNMLDANPQINCIFSTEGGGVPGLAKVVEKRGLKNDLVIIGMDDTQPNIQAVMSGYIYGVMSQDYYTMGYLGGKYAYFKSAGIDVPDTTNTTTELVTSEKISTNPEYYLNKYDKTMEKETN